MNIDPIWDLETAFREINERYRPGSQFGGRSRNLLLEMWGEVVGRNRAKAELETLIAKCGSTSKFCREFSITKGTLDALRAHFDGLPPDPEPAKQRLSAGDRIGPWTLLRRLGRGGGGEVWRATAREHGDVALKIPVGGKTHLRRFAAECRIMADLAGTAGVMPVLAMSENTDELPWMAMPIAEQVTPDAAGESKPVLRGILDVAQTLVRLHERGVSHRDIKPDNIYRLDGRWLISDFGIASFPGKEAMTVGGKKLGPLYFIAPEMLNNPDKADGQAADVYSLAKTMWVLLSGQAYPPPGEQRVEVEGLRLTSYVAIPRGELVDELMDHCTRYDPKTRPSVREVCDRLVYVCG